MKETSKTTRQLAGTSDKLQPSLIQYTSVDDETGDERLDERRLLIQQRNKGLDVDDIELVHSSLSSDRQY